MPLVLAVLLLLGGCASDGDGAPGDPVARAGGTAAPEEPAASTEPEATADAEVESGESVAAAEDYLAELTGWTAQVQRAVRRGRGLDAALAGAPTLAPVEDAGAAHGVAAQVEQRATAYAEELAALSKVDRIGSNAPLYSTYLDSWRVVFDASVALNKRLVPLLTGGGRGALRRQVELERRWAKRIDEGLATYSRRVGRAGLRGELGASIVAYARSEIAALRRLPQSYLAHLDRHRQPDDGLYSDRISVINHDFSAAVRAAAVERPRLTRDLGAGLVRLARAGARAVAQPGAGLAADAPSAGDAYRAAILRRAHGSRKESDETKADLAEQLWLLHRLGEVDEVPAEALEDARQTMLVQVAGDPRAAYERMFVAVTYLSAASLEGLDTYYPRRRRLVAEMLEAEQPPVPPLFEPAWRRIVRVVEQERPRTDRQLAQVHARLRKAMTSAARLADRERRLVPAIRRALEATRPGHDSVTSDVD